jgi:hypothetical protein
MVGFLLGLNIFFLEKTITPPFKLNGRSLRNSKDKYNNDLIIKITYINSSCKNWWNIVKQISGINGSDLSIPPILHNDNLMFECFE